MAGARQEAPATAEREIAVSRVIDAPRELVFEAFTEVRHLSQWWGPDGFTTTTQAFEFRVGGVWDFVMHGPDGTDYDEWITWTEIAVPDLASYVSRGVSAAASRYRAKVAIHAPADSMAAQLTPAAGTIEPIDEHTCLFSTGSDSVKGLAVHLGLLDADFEIQTGPAELHAHLRQLAERYGQASRAS